MSQVQPKQLWVSSEKVPETYYVLSVGTDATAKVVACRIEGVGLHAKIIGKGKAKDVKISEMLDTWMPTQHGPDPVPTWHEHLLADELSDD